MSKTLTVYLAANLKDFNQGMNDAEMRAQGFGGSLNNMLGPAMIAAAAAAAGLAVKLGVDGVKAAMDDEAAVARLTQTLANMGLEEAIGGVEAWIDATQRASGVADDELRPAYDRLIRSIGDVGETQRVLKIAMDASIGTGKSLDAVVQALGKAYDGNTAGLAKLGAGISKATLATGDMRVITQELADMFGGQAAAKASTFQGQIDRLGIGVNELKEAFGKGLLGALQDTNGETEALMGTMKNLEPVLESIGDKLGQAAINAGYATTAITSLANATGNNQQEDLIWGHLLDWINTGIMPDFLENLITYGRLQAAATDRQQKAQQAAKDLADQYGAGYRAIAELRRQTGGVIPIMAAMTDETDGLSKALAQMESRARSAANAWASAYGPILSALLDVGAYGEFMKRLTRLDTEAAPVMAAVKDNSRNMASSITQDAKTITAAQERMLASAEENLGGLRDQLSQAMDVLDEAYADVVKFSDGVHDALMKAFDPGTAFKNALSKEGKLDTQAWLAGMLDQIAQLDWFGNVLRSIRSSGTPGAMALADYLQSQGASIGGQMGQALIDKGLVSTMEMLFSATEAMATNLGDSMIPPMMLTGVEMAANVVDQLGAEVLASKDKLMEIGKSIGKPVGKAFEKEVMDSVAAAFAKAEETRSAAQARRQAAAASAALTALVTDQQAGQDLQRVINQSNARAGYASNAFGIVLG